MEQYILYSKVNIRLESNSENGYKYTIILLLQHDKTYHDILTVNGICFDCVLPVVFEEHHLICDEAVVRGAIKAVFNRSSERFSSNISYFVCNGSVPEH